MFSRKSFLFNEAEGKEDFFLHCHKLFVIRLIIQKTNLIDTISIHYELGQKLVSDGHFVIFRLNPERYKYKLFINKVTHMDLIITQSLWFILFLVLE